VLEHRKSFAWVFEVSCLCIWIFVIRLDYSENLLGSARGTELLPNCGRNEYNFLSAAIMNSIRLWTPPPLPTCFSHLHKRFLDEFNIIRGFDDWKKVVTTLFVKPLCYNWFLDEFNIIRGFDDWKKVVTTLFVKPLCYNFLSIFSLILTLCFYSLYCFLPIKKDKNCYQSCLKSVQYRLFLSLL